MNDARIAAAKIAIFALAMMILVWEATKTAWRIARAIGNSSTRDALHTALSLRGRSS